MKKLVFVMPLMAISLLASCGGKTPTKDWYEDTEFIKSLTVNDVGLVKEVVVNSSVHKVRLIGIDHDDLFDGSGKAHTTWEFVNLISDSDGYSLATPWYWEEEGLYSRSRDYINYSNLRKAMDGGGNARKIEWYQKGGTTESAAYTDSVLDMLPDNLKNVLKEVIKPVAVMPWPSAEWVINSTDYKTKLFPLSISELTEKDITYALKGEGSTYQFYKGKGDTDENRIKYQVKHNEGAATQPTIVDKDIGWSAYNNAGVNHNYKPGLGGPMWLRSPSVNLVVYEYFNAMCCVSDGSLNGTNAVAQYIYGVAPAFCI